MPGIDKPHRPPFRTTLEWAVEVVRWAKVWLGFLGKPRWVVADGAYAKAALLKPSVGPGVVVVGRLRKDAARRTVPAARTGKPGRPREYGEARVSRAKRAGPRRGWATGTCARYGKKVAKRDKTFAATGRPAGGAIGVVLGDEPRGWVAFFRTDPAAGVADILGRVAERFRRETTFRDGKGVVGAGPRQGRPVGASVGSFPLGRRAFTLTAAWAWGRAEKGRVAHRKASPGDDEPRRPSHADKRRAWQQELLAAEVHAVVGDRANGEEIRDLAERLLNLAA